MWTYEFHHVHTPFFLDLSIIFESALITFHGRRIWRHSNKTRAKNMGLSEKRREPLKQNDGLSSFFLLLHGHLEGIPHVQKHPYGVHHCFPEPSYWRGGRCDKKWDCKLQPPVNEQENNESEFWFITRICLWFHPFHNEMVSNQRSNDFPNLWRSASNSWPLNETHLKMLRWRDSWLVNAEKP